MAVCSSCSHKTLGSQNHDDALEMQLGTLEDQIYTFFVLNQGHLRYFGTL